MKIVFSHWSVQEPFLEMAALSNFFAQKLGYETVLISDDIGIKKLKNIKYDHIIQYPDIINSFPKEIWCLGKLLNFLILDEPFLHFDMDLFIDSDILSNINQQCDIICFYEEPWMDRIFNKNIEILKYNEINYFNDLKNKRSYNCAILGCLNNLPKIKIKTTHFLEEILSNQQIIKKIPFNQIDKFFLPCSIEQIKFIDYIKNQYNIDTILRTEVFPFDKLGKMINHNNYHFMGERKIKNIKFIIDLYNKNIK